MPDFIFEGSGMRELSRDLRMAAVRFRAEVDKTLVEIGTELTVEAKKLAGEHSKSIAATIKMTAAPGVVRIRAGADTVPIAALYELGNKGSKRSATTFRHPVFGSDVWVDQPKFPFLRPALAANRRSVTRRMEVTWDRALEPYRMKPGF